jgi:hypothetical protein
MIVDKVLPICIHLAGAMFSLGVLVWCRQSILFRKIGIVIIALVCNLTFQLANTIVLNIDTREAEHLYQLLKITTGINIYLSLLINVSVLKCLQVLIPSLNEKVIYSLRISMTCLFVFFETIFILCALFYVSGPHWFETIAPAARTLQLVWGILGVIYHHLQAMYLTKVIKEYGDERAVTKHWQNRLTKKHRKIILWNSLVSILDWLTILMFFVNRIVFPGNEMDLQVSSIYITMIGLHVTLQTVVLESLSRLAVTGIRNSKGSNLGLSSEGDRRVVKWSFSMK